MPRRPLRILIINPFGIGDVLFTTPLLRAIRKAFPDATLGYLCNRRTERILRNNPNLNAVFVYEKDDYIRLRKESVFKGWGYMLRLLRSIRKKRFDLLIDLSLGERYALILRLLGIRQRIGFNYRKRGRLLTESLPIAGYHDEHVIRHYGQLLRFMGIHLRDEHSEFQLTEGQQSWARSWMKQHGLEDSERALVGIIPAGGVSWGTHASFRRWGSEGFAEVADRLIESLNVKVILFGEASDSAACKEVAGLMHHPVLDVSGQTNLEEFVSLMARLDLVICNDGGPLHLAVSQRVKTVSVFGPVDPRVYGPYPIINNEHALVYAENLPCRPCYHRFKLPPCPYERACLTTIPYEAVFRACKAILSRHTSKVSHG